MPHDERMDNSTMSLSEIVRTLRYHDKDLYRGNGKPGVIQRIAELETYRERNEADFYDADTGVMPRLTKFFAVAEEREKRQENSMTRYMAIMAAIAIGCPIAWDIVKHFSGWLK